MVPQGDGHLSLILTILQWWNLGAQCANTIFSPLPPGVHLSNFQQYEGFRDS